MWVSDRISSYALVPYKKANDVFFIEEGATSYIISADNSLKRIIKTALGYRYNFFADDKLISMYVTKPDCYCDAYLSKVKLLDITVLEKSLSIEAKKRIISVFYNKNLHIVRCANACLVLTQPLSEDNHLTKSEKYFCYKKICDVLSTRFRILIKPHPRDKMNYSGIKNSIILPSQYPAELINLLDIDFELVVGICTSAIFTVNAKEKINLNMSFFIDKKLNIEELENYL
jgi:hypothetical protein